MPPSAPRWPCLVLRQVLACDTCRYCNHAVRTAALGSMCGAPSASLPRSCALWCKRAVAVPVASISMVILIFRNAAGILVVYDITDRTSFERAVRWLDELPNTMPSDAVLVLVGALQNIMTWALFVHQARSSSLSRMEFGLMCSIPLLIPARWQYSVESQTHHFSARRVGCLAPWSLKMRCLRSEQERLGRAAGRDRGGGARGGGGACGQPLL
jgi:Ras family